MIIGRSEWAKRVCDKYSWLISCESIRWQRFAMKQIYANPVFYSLFATHTFAHTRKARCNTHTHIYGAQQQQQREMSAMNREQRQLDKLSKRTHTTKKECRAKVLRTHYSREYERLVPHSTIHSNYNMPDIMQLLLNRCGLDIVRNFAIKLKEKSYDKWTEKDTKMNLIEMCRCSEKKCQTFLKLHNILYCTVLCCAVLCRIYLWRFPILGQLQFA